MRAFVLLVLLGMCYFRTIESRVYCNPTHSDIRNITSRLIANGVDITLGYGQFECNTHSMRVMQILGLHTSGYGAVVQDIDKVDVYGRRTHHSRVHVVPSFRNYIDMELDLSYVYTMNSELSRRYRIIGYDLIRTAAIRLGIRMRDMVHNPNTLIIGIPTCDLPNESIRTIVGCLTTYGWRLELEVENDTRYLRITSGFDILDAMYTK